MSFKETAIENRTFSVLYVSTATRYEVRAFCGSRPSVSYLSVFRQSLRLAFQGHEAEQHFTEQKLRYGPGRVRYALNMCII